MSNVSGAPIDFDFWEFVGCSICHLEFIKENGALSSLPFWLTECGHVVCNAHLSADQSCAACGSPGIQLIPLQRELDPPMSTWFTSVPGAFDTLAYSLRFQMNTMATLVRHFKKKYQQYRPLYERLRVEHAETKRLRKLLDEVQQENTQLRRCLQMGDGSDQTNVNGKRARVGDDGGQRTSSPRSVTTPFGPDRLTLLPGHHQPQFNSRQSIRTPKPAEVKQNLGHYAYVPPQTAQAQSMAMPVLSHIQSGSSRRAQGREDSEGTHRNGPMPPPPLPRGLEQRASVDHRLQHPPATPQLGSGSMLLQRPSSLPPPTPQIDNSGGSQRFVPSTPSRETATMTSASHNFGSGSSRPQQRQEFSTQRFIPTGSAQRLPAMASASASSSRSLAGSASIPQRPMRTASMTASGMGNQRAPFIPGSGAAFS